MNREGCLFNKHFGLGSAYRSKISVDHCTILMLLGGIPRDSNHPPTPCQNCSLTGLKSAWIEADSFQGGFNLGQSLIVTGVDMPGFQCRRDLLLTGAELPRVKAVSLLGQCTQGPN